MQQMVTRPEKVFLVGSREEILTTLTHRWSAGRLIRARTSTLRSNRINKQTGRVFFLPPPSPSVLFNAIYYKYPDLHDIKSGRTPWIMFPKCTARFQNILHLQTWDTREKGTEQETFAEACYMVANTDRMLSKKYISLHRTFKSQWKANAVEPPLHNSLSLIKAGLSNVSHQSSGFFFFNNKYSRQREPISRCVWRKDQDISCL